MTQPKRLSLLRRFLLKTYVRGLHRLMLMKGGCTVVASSGFGCYLSYDLT